MNPIRSFAHFARLFAAVFDAVPGADPRGKGAGSFRHLVFLALAAALAIFSPRHAGADEPAPLRVAAAASLADALGEIKPLFATATGIQVELNLGASSTLARQIEEGAPMDVFFSADQARMDALAAKGLLVDDTRKGQLANALVVVVPSDSTAQIAALEDLASARVSRIATGNPRSVPVGIYARRYLGKAGLWARLEPKIVATENSRAALAAVESGNMDAGIVYKTDAAISKKVKVALEIPAMAELPIVYPVAALKRSSQIERARAYLRFLDTSAAKAVFQKHGFIVLPEVSGPE